MSATADFESDTTTNVNASTEGVLAEGGPHEHSVEIVPPSGWSMPSLSEVWRYRDLMLLLVWRDVVGRYRQSVVGLGWILIRPIITTLIFTFIFGGVAKIDSGDKPYALFCFAALLPWTYFMACVSTASASVVASRALITKVYFPRVLLPIVAILSSTIDMLVQFSLLFLMMAYFGVGVSLSFLALVPFLGMAALSAAAVGIWMTAINVKFRDIGHSVPFLMQSWMWLSPVIYSSREIPPGYRFYYGLNPMVSVIDGFRWAILGLPAPNPVTMGVSMGMMVVLLITGLLYFRKVETRFADII